RRRARPRLSVGGQVDAHAQEVVPVCGGRRFGLGTPGERAVVRGARKAPRTTASDTAGRGAATADVTRRSRTSEDRCHAMSRDFSISPSPYSLLLLPSFPVWSRNRRIA